MTRCASSWRASSYSAAGRTSSSGKFKRTLHLTDDDTPEERQSFQDKIVSIHKQFVAVVKKYRPAAKIDEVQEADHWTAQESQELGLGLIDELGTSSSYLLKRNREADLVFLGRRVSPFQQMGSHMEAGICAAIERLIGMSI